MSRTLRIFAWVMLILGLMVGGFVIWASTPAGALMPEAEAALMSGARVEVLTEPYLTFRPTDGEASTGLVFYPGGRVQPEAYAPFAQAIAQQGYLVVIPAMPLQLAVLSPSAAADVMAAFPAVTSWAVGGHSLGGAMAANFARANLDSVEGLVLWASYPQESDSLAGTDIVAASVYGTLDGLATVEQVEESRAFLPDDALFAAVEGGNHAQFGWYGDQAGDNPATITRADQMAQTVEATVAVLAEIAGG
jgi:dienelactone hydrolase